MSPLWVKKDEQHLETPKCLWKQSQSTQQLKEGYGARQSTMHLAPRHHARFMAENEAGSIHELMDLTAALNLGPITPSLNEPQEASTGKCASEFIGYRAES